MQLQATYADPVQLTGYTKAQCGSVGSLGVYYNDGNDYYDTLGHAGAQATGDHGNVPADWDFVCILLPYCGSLGWGGIGWVGFPGLALNVYAYTRAGGAPCVAFGSLSLGTTTRSRTSSATTSGPRTRPT